MDAAIYVAAYSFLQFLLYVGVGFITLYLLLKVILKLGRWWLNDLPRYDAADHFGAGCFVVFMTGITVLLSWGAGNIVVHLVKLIPGVGP